MIAPPPDFSIITATWNSEKTLAACIDSVRAQIGVNVQHVICDGKSSDGTLSIVEDKMYPGLTLTSEADSGVYEAWNRGIRLATGKWILFLGSDDLLNSQNTLKDVMNRISSSSNHRLFYGMVQKERLDGTPIGTFGDDYTLAQAQLDPPTLRFPPHPASVFERSLFADYPLFDTTYKICADSLHLGRIMRDIKPKFLPIVITRFRTGGLSNNRKNALRKWREKHAITRTMGYRVPKSAIIVSFLRACAQQLRS